MDDWFQDWVNALETTRKDVEDFFQSTADAMIEVTDAVVQASETVAEQMQVAIATELEHLIEQLDDWFAPPPHFSLGIEVYWDSGLSDEPWLETVKPSSDRYEACIGCRHYHGRIYNGNPLVCAIHPYGWDEQSCPDWEQR